MKLQSVLGVMGLVATALLFSASGAAAIDASGGGPSNPTVDIGGVTSFKPSPNVYIHYESDNGTAGASTTYVGGSVHSQGDRAYGVDPDYTGMYVATVPAGTTDPWDAGAPTVAAGSSTDFGTGWTAK